MARISGQANTGLFRVNEYVLLMHVESRNHFTLTFYIAAGVHSNRESF